LVHTYKVGKKVRQQNILNFGKLENISKGDYKLLANRIKDILTTTSSFSDFSYVIEQQLKILQQLIIKKEVFT